MLTLRVLLLALALALPALAQTPSDDGPSIAAGAKDAAAQLQPYLDKIAKSRSRPDFTKPPASDLFGRIFDFGKLAALPAPSARDTLAFDLDVCREPGQQSDSLFRHHAAG